MSILYQVIIAVVLVISVASVKAQIDTNSKNKTYVSACSALEGKVTHHGSGFFTSITCNIKGQIFTGAETLENLKKVLRK